MQYKIIHKEELVGWYYVEADSEQEALKKFKEDVESAQWDYSDMELVDSSDEVVLDEYPEIGDPVSIMKFKIYQINTPRDDRGEKFIGFEDRKHFGLPAEVDGKIYDLVFSGEVDCKGLEDVYEMFNLRHPDGYIGHSLSVSDVVEIIDAKELEPGFYFCDNIGFRKIAFDSGLANVPGEK